MENLVTAVHLDQSSSPKCLACEVVREVLCGDSLGLCGVRGVYDSTSVTIVRVDCVDPEETRVEEYTTTADTVLVKQSLERKITARKPA